MKSLKYFFVIFCLLSLAIFYNSCVKDYENVTKLPSIDKYRIIGQEHNRVIKLVFNELDLTENDKIGSSSYIHNRIKMAIPTEFNEYQKTNISDKFHFHKMIASGNIPTNDEFLNDICNSELLKKLIRDLVLAVSEGNQNISELNNKITEIEKIGIKNLDEADLHILLSATSIGMYSSKLWYPESLGGEEYFKEIILSNRLNTSLRGINWGKLAGHDVIGAVAGAAGALIASGGAAAVPNPLLGGMPTAGAYALVSGGFASAHSAWDDLFN